MDWKMKYPKLFEMEGLDPEQLKVQLVRVGEDGRFTEQVLDNIRFTKPIFESEKFVGPMAGKIDGEWCIRFECKETYKKLSSDY